MFQGLDRFAEHFKGFENSYVLIGGVACTLWMEHQGLSFGRVTKDLDIVIVVEALSTDFIKRFWDFVYQAGYEALQRSTDKKVCYRFSKPGKKEYPFMLELFARNPFNLEPEKGVILTPIPASDALSSLSAILMDEGYYSLVMTMKTQTNRFALPIIPASALIPLKAKAWLDLTLRKKNGEQVDEHDIKKHRRDIFLLTRTLTAEKIPVPETLAADIQDFLNQMQKLPKEERVNLEKALSFDMKAAIGRLRGIYSKE